MTSFPSSLFLFFCCLCKKLIQQYLSIFFRCYLNFCLPASSLPLYTGRSEIHPNILQAQ
jgi:hypothetical protein